MTESMPHVITGAPEHVAAALRRARAQGRLESVTSTRVLPDHRVQVLARLRPSRVPSRWTRVRPWLLGAAKVTAALAGLAAVAGLVWLVVLTVMSLIALVMAVVAWVQAHLAAIVLGAALLVLLLLAGLSGGRCGGMHCGGCRR